MQTKQQIPVIIDVLVDTTDSIVQGWIIGGLYNDLCETFGDEIDLITTNALIQGEGQDRTPWFTENVMKERLYYKRVLHKTPTKTRSKRFIRNGLSSSEERGNWKQSYHKTPLDSSGANLRPNLELARPLPQSTETVFWGFLNWLCTLLAVFSCFMSPHPDFLCLY